MLMVNHLFPLARTNWLAINVPMRMKVKANNESAIVLK